MSATSESTKHKAQVYDLALNAFFRARDLDAESLGTDEGTRKALVGSALSPPS